MLRNSSETFVFITAEYKRGLSTLGYANELASTLLPQAITSHTRIYDRKK